MNIIFITKDFIPKIGGVEIHVSKLAAEIVKDKHRVNIFTLLDKGENTSEDKFENPTIHRLSSGHLSDRISLYLQLSKKIVLFLKADVIHFHDFSIMRYFLPFVYIFKMLKKRIYITFHGWEGIFPPPPDIIRKRAQCESLANGNICIGDYIPIWYGTKTNIISYGGVEKKNISNVSEKNIVFIGRLNSDTGILQYLEAWKKIQIEYQNLNLIICGDGPLKDIINNEIKEQKLLNVTLTGMIRNTDSFLKDAAVVFTSGYLSMLDAFSYKKKVISVYDNDLKKDYLKLMPGSNEMFWIAGNSEEIFNAYRDAVNDNVKVEKAFKFAQENDWAKVKEEYYKLWKL